MLEPTKEGNEDGQQQCNEKEIFKQTLFLTFENPLRAVTGVCSGVVCRNWTDSNHTVGYPPEKEGIREALLLTHSEPSQRQPALTRAPSAGKIAI